MEEIDKILAQFIQTIGPTNKNIEKTLPEIRFILLKIWLKKSEALAIVDSWYFINKMKNSSTLNKKLEDLGLNN